MSSIAAGTTLTTALVSTGDTTGELVFKTNGTTTALTIDTSQNVTIINQLTANDFYASSGFYTNPQTITANYTLASTSNAMSTGPVTVDSGVTVTIDSGSRWVVI
jgi:hypothetical protein